MSIGSISNQSLVTLKTKPQQNKVSHQNTINHDSLVKRTAIAGAGIGLAKQSFDLLRAAKMMAVKNNTTLSKGIKILIDACKAEKFAGFREIAITSGLKMGKYALGAVLAVGVIRAAALKAVEKSDSQKIAK